MLLWQELAKRNSIKSVKKMKITLQKVYMNDTPKWREMFWGKKIKFSSGSYKCMVSKNSYVNTKRYVCFNRLFSNATVQTKSRKPHLWMEIFPGTRNFPSICFWDYCNSAFIRIAFQSSLEQLGLFPNIPVTFCGNVRYFMRLSVVL